MTTPIVTSEIGDLETVMVHRPGIEIARITPDNKEALLFDDLLWLERAQEEHDRFVTLLESRGAEVLHFGDLLADCLAIDDLRTEIVDAVFTDVRCGPRVAEQMRQALREAPARAACDVLVGGLLESELVDWGIDPVFAEVAADRFHYVLRPLPNLLFMRDNAAWVGGGLVRSVLAYPAREIESFLVGMVYRHHPRFADADFPVWFGSGHDAFPATIEGGDVLVLDEHTVLVGLGERTAPSAVEILARRLFTESGFRRIIGVHLRKDRSVMHLDTVFTMVDHGTFNVFPGLLGDVDVHVISPGSTRPIDVRHFSGLQEALQRTLDLDAPRFIPTGGDAIGRLREQWDDGNNTLAIAPGVVIAYARNAETNRRLREHDIEVLELDASELGRGRGGSRCMTQPIRRAPL